METTLNLVKERIEEYLKRSTLRFNAIYAAISTENDGKEPTFDINGRFHAPCHGYQLPDDERVYGAGEYLPVDYPEEVFLLDKTLPKSSFKYEGRVKMTPANFDSFSKMIEENNYNFLNVSRGKSWNCDDYTLRTYCYVKGTSKSLVNDIEKILEELNITKVDYNKLPEVYLEGIFTVSGTVTKTWFEENYYGYINKTMVVCDNGVKFFSTVPAAISNVKTGELVNVTATFTKGTNGWSKCSRPRKASIVKDLEKPICNA